MPRLLALLLLIGAAGHMAGPLRAMASLAMQGMIFATQVAAP